MGYSESSVYWVNDLVESQGKKDIYYLKPFIS